jgi:hypothetical protein
MALLERVGLVEKRVAFIDGGVIRKEGTPDALIQKGER